MEYPSLVQSLDEIAFEKTIQYAASMGDVRLLRHRLANGANVLSSYEGFTALHYAAKRSVGITEEMLKHVESANMHSYINARTPLGETALHRAMDGNLASLLLRHGADVNAVDDNGQTAYQKAITSDRKELARVIQVAMQI